ncbi:hypothetical protein BB559_000562 [Furculomyces boomerangus]|uniref:SAM domain-containing protein n=1 Tax=Furculomyces boomerangus TaxID=61424 RepID=A0A2T9Z4Z0_9FUNG|nr:hypothetical protein BB559_000562 [Furculomyces boomerangus]
MEKEEIGGYTDGFREDVPLRYTYQDDPRRWSSEEVCRWFNSQPSLIDLVPIIKNHCLDGHVLLNYISNAVLKDELGISAFGKRVRILEALEALKWKVNMLHKESNMITNGNQDTYNDGRSQISSFDGESIKNSMEGYSESRSTIKLSGFSTGGSSITTTNYRKRGMYGEIDDKEMKKILTRMADAEKKRQKRAELKKDPAAYAIYLQKERDRNAKRRAKLKERGGNAQEVNSYDSCENEKEMYKTGSGENANLENLQSSNISPTTTVNEYSTKSGLGEQKNPLTEFSKGESTENREKTGNDYKEEIADKKEEFPTMEKQECIIEEKAVRGEIDIKSFQVKTTHQKAVSIMFPKNFNLVKLIRKKTPRDIVKQEKVKKEIEHEVEYEAEDELDYKIYVEDELDYKMYVEDELGYKMYPESMDKVKERRVKEESEKKVQEKEDQEVQDKVKEVKEDQEVQEGVKEKVKEDQEVQEKVKEEGKGGEEVKEQVKEEGKGGEEVKEQVKEEVKEKVQEEGEVKVQKETKKKARKKDEDSIDILFREVFGESEEEDERRVVENDWKIAERISGRPGAISFLSYYDMKLVEDVMNAQALWSQEALWSEEPGYYERRERRRVSSPIDYSTETLNRWLLKHRRYLFEKECKYCGTTFVEEGEYCGALDRLVHKRILSLEQLIEEMAIIKANENLDTPDRLPFDWTNLYAGMFYFAKIENLVHHPTDQRFVDEIKRENPYIDYPEHKDVRKEERAIETVYKGLEQPWTKDPYFGIL